MNSFEIDDSLLPVMTLDTLHLNNVFMDNDNKIHRETKLFLARHLILENVMSMHGYHPLLYVDKERLEELSLVNN